MTETNVTEFNGLTYENLTEFKENLEEQFKSLTVSLDESSDEFVESIYIDGTSVSIVLVDSSIVKGELENLNLQGLHLENFHVIDSKSITDNHNETYGNYPDTSDEYKTHKKLTVSFPNFKPICINNTFKFSDLLTNVDISHFSDLYYDISHCQNIWLDNFYIDRDLLETINSDSSLQRLFLTYCETLDEDTDNHFTLNLPELKTLILDLSAFNSLNNIDLSGCNKLEKISFGDNTRIEDLNFLSGLNNLRVVSFGNLSPLDGSDILKSIEEEEETLLHAFRTDDKRLAQRSI